MTAKKWTICFVFLLIIILSAISVFTRQAGNNVVPIFSDIEECESLNKYKTNTVLQDEYLEKLPFQESYTAEIEYDSIKFKIFAYEFKTIDDAKEYYSNFRQQKVKEEHSYHFSSGMFKSKGIVLNGNNLYRIECSNADISDLKEYLSSIFSLKYVSGKGFEKNTRETQGTVLLSPKKDQ